MPTHTTSVYFLKQFKPKGIPVSVVFEVYEFASQVEKGRFLEFESDANSAALNSFHKKSYMFNEITEAYEFAECLSHFVIVRHEVSSVIVCKDES